MVKLRYDIEALKQGRVVFGLGRMDSKVKYSDAHAKTAEIFDEDERQ